MENSRRMVKVLITDCHQRLRRFQDRVRQAVDKLTPMIDAPAIFQLRGAIRSLSGADAAEKRRSLDKKMSRLMSSTSHPAPEVHKLSSKQLSANQMRALDRGMKFNLSDASPLDFVASLDSVLERARVPDDDRHLIRQQISTLIINQPRRPIIPPAEKKAIEELKADESIVILPADKGRSTVVMDKQAYVEKAAALLNDEETYEPVEGDPMKKLASRTQKKLMSLKSSGAITKKEYHWIKPSDAPLARFYCLPKVHKEEVPLRPIVTLRGSPMFNLSAWLARLLRPLTLHSETTVPSPKQFLNRLRGVRVKPDEVMVSFDVTSLFTSIPKDVAESVVRDSLEAHYDDSDRPLKKDDIIEILRTCLRTFFCFDSRVYEQKKGAPMGSPISGHVAELVLQGLEASVFSSFQPTFWARYVDDTFAIVKKDRVEELNRLLNSVHPTIQFTREDEQGGELPFLDVLVRRGDDGSLHTRVYRKATNTLQILSFHSNHPATHKRSCVKTLFRRVDTHCSSREAKKVETRYLWSQFTANGYPATFIRKTLRHRPLSSTPPQPQLWHSLPYMGNVSEAAARILQPFGIGVAHKPASTMRSQVSHVKDRVPLAEQTNVIYQVPCKDCSSRYTGLTTRRLETRLKEHSSAVRNENVKASLMAAHCQKTKHTFDFEATSILARAGNWWSLQIKEAWYSPPGCVNKHIDLPPAYLALRSRLGRIKPPEGLPPPD